MDHNILSIQHFTSPFTCYHTRQILVEGQPDKTPYPFSINQRITAVATALFAGIATSSIPTGLLAFYVSTAAIKWLSCSGSASSSSSDSFAGTLLKAIGLYQLINQVTKWLFDSPSSSAQYPRNRGRNHVHHQPGTHSARMPAHVPGPARVHHPDPDPRPARQPARASSPARDHLPGARPARQLQPAFFSARGVGDIGGGD